MRLSAALQGYWLDKQLHFSATTTPRYQLTFRRLVEFVGDVEIASITGDDLRRFLAHLSSTYRLSKRTVHDSWVHLSSLWTWAEVELQIAHILRNQVRQPEFTRRKPDPFTSHEIKRLLTGVARDAGGARRATAARDYALLLTLLDTGLRVSELCALTIADYDAEQGRLHVRHGKGRGGGKERFVVVGKRTQKALWRYLATREITPAAPLFATRAGGVLTRTELHHQLARLGKRVGVTHVHPHRFRHTFAITFLRNGGNLAVLKELLGHEALQMVLHYAELAQHDIDASQRYSPVDNWRL
jgi:integrase/recombinase XerD